jgi:hypothetical protein
MTNFFEKYKYPDEVPNVEKNDHGWFSKWHYKLIVPLVKDKKLVLELGSWYGKSTRAWLANSNAKVICVDTWQGSIEHDGMDLSKLYDTFIKNQSEWKDRVYPVRMKTEDGLKEIKNCGINPDFIYIDASHQYEDVYSDVKFCYESFKNALICGDDWMWRNKSQGNKRTVQMAVTKFCSENGLTVSSNTHAWYIDK